MLNVVSVNISDLASGKKPELQIDIPEEVDYKYARERVDERTEYRRYSFERLQRAKLVYVPLPSDLQYANPFHTKFNATWNGMRDSLSVDEFFFLAGILEEELRTVFHFDPTNDFHAVVGGYFGFTEGGQQRLADLAQRPLAYIQLRQTGRNRGSWNLSSKQIFNPSMKGEIEK